MTREILRSFGAFGAAVSGGCMFDTGLIFPGAARSVYAILGGSVRIFRFPRVLFFTGWGLSLALKKGNRTRRKAKAIPGRTAPQIKIPSIR